jgi:hypothetical protein
MFCLLVAEDVWTGKWFPSNPNDKQVVENVTTSTASSVSWNGKWYATTLILQSDKLDKLMKLNTSRFPNEPANDVVNTQTFEQDRIMGIPNKDCDDGKVNSTLFYHFILLDIFLNSITQFFNCSIRRQISRPILIQKALSTLCFTLALNQHTSRIMRLNQFKPYTMSTNYIHQFINV